MFFAPAIRSRSLQPRSASLLDSGFERFMNEAFRGLGGLGELQEDEHTWTLSMDVPGIAKKHLQVQVEGRTVRVESTKDAQRQFSAIYELPEEVKTEDSSASLENGVLTLKLAKAQPVQRRQIAIR